MSQINDLKQALENLSSKPDVLTHEAQYAKESVGRQQRNQQVYDDENTKKLLNEFNTSVNLLSKVFQQSNFDSVMGLVMDPLRLLVLNFLMSLIKGMAFMFGAVIILWICFQVYRDLIF